MSRSEILKCRCSPEELDTLQAQLTEGETLSELIRGRLGLTCSPKRTSARVSANNNPLPTVTKPSPQPMPDSGIASNKFPSGILTNNDLTIILTQDNGTPKAPKKKRGWGWLLLAGFILALLALGYFIIQVQMYFMGG